MRTSRSEWKAATKAAEKSASRTSKPSRVCAGSSPGVMGIGGGVGVITRIVWREAPRAPAMKESKTKLFLGAAMQLGMIGLGRMGANMVRRLMKAGHRAWCTTATRTR